MNDEGKAKSRLRIDLYPKAEAAVRGGHPWVYQESIRGQNRDGDPGELAIMYDRNDRFLAIGLFDPGSPIRIRILHHGAPAMLNQDWWIRKAQECKERRSQLFLDDSTTGFRVINGESEGFPGLVLDKYGETFVVKIYTASWLPLLDTIEVAFHKVFAPQYLILRMSRKVARDSANLGINEGFLGRKGPEVVSFKENGIYFEAAVLHGQKTGFFLDQRDNRLRVEELSEGREVLNVFSFSGAFSLYAARGKAKSVTNLDISTYALESAVRNFELNCESLEVLDVRQSYIRADAFKWLGEANETYDLIVTDPPSLAKRASERKRAMHVYRKLNESAVKILRPGGVLIAASCSAHVSAEDFFKLIRKTSRNHRELWRSRHAEDHPATFKEAEYLKAICIVVT